MRLGGRLQAAAEVLEDVLERRTPASMALRDWGKAHRFAGSKDRNAIGNIVHDALRAKSSIGFQMDSETPRSLALGAAVFGGLVSVEALQEQTKDDKYFSALTPMRSQSLRARLRWLTRQLGCRPMCRSGFGPPLRIISPRRPYPKAKPLRSARLWICGLTA